MSGPSAAASCEPQTSEVPHSRSSRPSLSREQVDEYLQAIGLPEPFASSSVLHNASLTRTERALPVLAAMMRYHFARIPFENLALHYEGKLAVTLDTQELFERMVRGRRGGYCFQQNGMFGAVMRALGFDVMSTAARVSNAVEPVAGMPNFQGFTYGGWNHGINIVRIASKDYLIDVGMAAFSAIVPVELAEYEGVSIAPRTVRLTRACIPEYTSCRESNRLWNLEARNKPSDPWTPVYCFSTTEFLPVDFEALSWYVSTSRRSWFTQYLNCTKLILSDDGSKVVGDVTLFGTMLRKRIAGKAVFEHECKSEADRVAVLKTHFQIELTRIEQEAIMGTSVQIM